jgi:magnesium transporter
MTVRAWRCDATGVHELGALPADTPSGSFLWVEAEDPTDAERSELADRLRLSPLTVGDVTAVRRPAHTGPDEARVFVMRALSYAEHTSTVESGPIAVLLTPTALLSVRRCPQNPLPAARARLATDPTLSGGGPWAGLYTIVDQVDDGYVDVAAALAKDVTDLERRVFAKGREDLIDRIYYLIREVLQCREAVEPMLMVAEEVSAGRPRLHDVERHLRWAHTSVRNSEYLLTTILSAHQSQIALWQNEDMRKISAWAAIIAVPTLVSGVYGMNFTHMPELRWPFGYPVAVAVMVLACWVLYKAFRRNGWL